MPTPKFVTAPLPATTPNRMGPPPSRGPILYFPLRALMEAARAAEPIMVDKAGAARFYTVSVSTYDKYTKKGLVPPMNAVGRVSVEALKRNAFKLDGLDANGAIADPAERALRDWESAP